MNKYIKYFRMFNGKSETEQLDIMEKLLIKNGFKETVAFGRDYAKTIWFKKDGADNVFALAVNNWGRYLPMILPRDFAEHYYMVNGELSRPICIQTHSYMDSELVAKFASKRLHRLIFDFYGIDIKGFEIDHKSCHQGVNVLEELRPCTSSQNKANKANTNIKGTGDFSYNPLHDFSQSIYIPFLHYVLGEIPADGMETLRNMEILVA